MAIVVKNNFIVEDITDTEGNVLGQIKFNPNDARIMSKLAKIINDLGDKLEEIKGLGTIPKIPNENLETVEDFEKVAEIFKDIHKGLNLEEEAIDNTIRDLTEIFGEETINVFTGGTEDIMSLLPLLEYVMPYVKEARSKKVNSYIKNDNDDVME